MAEGDINYGSEYPFNSADTTIIETCSLDSTHVVVAYRDNGNSNYGTAIVGVISSDDVITWGSEYVFKSAATEHIAITKLTSTTFAVGYSHSNLMHAKVGTVASGDEISYGSEGSVGIVGRGELQQELSMCAMSSTIVLIAKIIYVPSGGGFYDSKLTVVRLVVTGTSIGAGLAGRIDFADDAEAPSATSLDSTHAAIAYKDTTAATGKAIIATENSTQYDAGTAYVFNNASSIYIGCCALDSSHISIVYTDAGGTNDGEAVVGVISSGDVITFGSTYTFESGAATYCDCCMISSTEFIIAFRDAVSEDGTGIIATVASDDEISFGSDYAWTTDATFATAVTCLDSTHIAFSFRDENTYGVGIIGVIEGAAGGRRIFITHNQ